MEGLEVLVSSYRFSNEFSKFLLCSTASEMGRINFASRGHGKVSQNGISC